MSGINAYQKTQKVQATPRQTEADVLLRVGREMEVAQHGTVQDMNDAMLRNISLWQLLAFDCAEDGNQLPEALRHQIISLAVWVVRQSDRVMVGEASPESLIEINRTIARGLMPAPSQADAPPAAPSDASPVSELG